jgi:hypothetical protein
VNEELTLELSLGLTLTQHPRDENPELRKVHARLEVDPPRVWYYLISPNSRTLVLLLQVDPVSGNEPKTICEGCTRLNMPLFSHGLQFPALYTIVGCTI